MLGGDHLGVDRFLLLLKLLDPGQFPEFLAHGDELVVDILNVALDCQFLVVGVLLQVEIDGNVLGFSVEAGHADLDGAFSWELDGLGAACGILGSLLVSDPGPQG